MGYIADHATETAKWRWRLVSIAFSPVMYLTDCPTAIEYDGHTWSPRGVQVTNLTNPETGATMNFTAADADGYVFAFLADTNGAEGLVVNAYLAEFAIGSTSAAPDDVVQIFTGRVASARKNTGGGIDQVEFSCGPPTVTPSITFPYRTIASLVRDPV